MPKDQPETYMVTLFCNNCGHTGQVAQFPWGKPLPPSDRFPHCEYCGVNAMQRDTQWKKEKSK